MTLKSGVREEVFFPLSVSNDQERLSPLEDSPVSSVGCLFTHRPEVDVSSVT